MRWPAACALTAALFAGAVLRLVWVADMEYKGDEVWTFERTRYAERGEAFPLAGMPTSVRLPNPGLSVWAFLGLARLARAHEPMQLAHAVQVLNVAAILFIAAFALCGVPPPQREAWLWAAALAAVNPLAVLFHRKIWPPSVTPFFSTLLVACWWQRHRRWGAFAWGITGSLLGQFHLAGFFFAAGLLTWTRLFDRRPIAWRYWVGGSLCGLPTLLLWLSDLAAHWGEASVGRWRFPQLKFWLQWGTEPFGIGLAYSLGHDFAGFLAGPTWNGYPTYLVGLAHAVAAGIALVVFLRAGAALRRSGIRWHDVFIGRASETVFVVSASLWGYGILLVATGLPFYRHYLLLAFPLTFVWAAVLALEPAPGAPPRVGRLLLAALCVTEALISVSFLAYVHAHQTGIRGDYGVPYGAQGRAGDVLRTR